MSRTKNLEVFRETKILLMILKPMSQSNDSEDNYVLAKFQDQSKYIIIITLKDTGASSFYCNIQ